MDNNAPDHRQMPSPMIKLESSDGVIFQVEVKVARLSLHLKRMMDHLDEEDNEVISIPQNGPNISGAILEKIIQWANHHKDDPVAAEDSKKDIKPTNAMSRWDAEFLQLDPTTLVQIIRAANYLDIQGLLDVTCTKLAMMIKEMTVEKVRQRFGLHNDFSSEEEEQVRREYIWFKGYDCDDDSDPKEEVRSVNASFSVETPTDSVQNMDMEIIDNGYGQDLEDCLNNSIVARKIFQHFSDTELLKLSFVNKLWNYEALSVIKRRGELFAHVRCTSYGDEPCQGKAQDFIAAVQQMNILPFSGINLCIRHDESRGCTNEIHLNDISLDQLQLKKFSLSVELYARNKSCSALLLAKKVFQDFSEDLEELSFDNDALLEGIVKQLVQQSRFPRLKVLKLGYGLDTNTMKVLVSRSPTLQEVHTTHLSSSVFNALEGSTSVIVSVQEAAAPFLEVTEATVGVLRVEHMKLLYTGLRFNFEKFSSIAPTLMQASCTTVRSMIVDTILAVPLMCYEVCLEKVEQLEMYINYRLLQQHEPRILGLVKDFDFTRIFPNLKKVKISRGSLRKFPPEHMDRIVELANAVPPDPTPDRAANIKELHLNECKLSNATVQFWRGMFPCIEKLHVDAAPEEEVCFGPIWKHWVHLKDLEVLGTVLHNSGNLDSIFCGIFPEEVAELRQKDEEHLKRVNIVPVMPAITCLRNLQSLYLGHTGEFHQPEVHDGTLMFSKVTGFIAFSRCPSLVEITLDFGANIPEAAANHMKPFAFVTTC